MSLYLVVRNPSIVDTDVQNILSICVFSIDCNPTLNTNVLVSLGNPDQAQNIDLFFMDGTPITFDSLGTFVFEGVNPDTCATILGTFRELGNYEFHFALLEETSNAPIDRVSETVRVIGESSGTIRTPEPQVAPSTNNERTKNGRSENGQTDLAQKLQMKQLQNSSSKKSKYKRPKVIKSSKQ
ncbi:hypothetical protein [Alkalihalobacillus sp. CinArs1]|uniref:hypothetical protein n=1 Tax=Alkalihalobacillus sp. CinArs1 TaxID=2995314 RepID=UPI0022DDEF13|nr:hypothetical protein [Alkalihalobacillus sp. CinArs1]